MKIRNLFKEPIIVPLLFLDKIAIPFGKIVLFNAKAVTVWPIIFYTRQAADYRERLRPEIKAHEMVHWRHQRNMGTILGMLLWYVVYLALLMVLPLVYLTFAHRRMRISEHPLETDAHAAERAFDSFWSVDKDTVA